MAGRQFKVLMGGFRFVEPHSGFKGETPLARRQETGAPMGTRYV